MHPATYFEASMQTQRCNFLCMGGKTTEAAMALAKLCFDTLMEEGVKPKLHWKQVYDTGSRKK